MRIATIVPRQSLHLTKGDDYFMCLAHLMHNPRYAQFFYDRAEDGKHVIMDNGVVETGIPMSIERLYHIRAGHRTMEIILPDVMHNTVKTLQMGNLAFEWVMARYDIQTPLNVMAVPQGKTEDEWLTCMREMVFWPVRSIGISRFVLDHSKSRLSLLMQAEELIESNKEIHILGCPEDPLSMFQLDQCFPERLRGVDSGAPTFYTAGGTMMGVGHPRPEVKVDFLDYDSSKDAILMEHNVQWWRDRCRGEV